SPIDFQFQVSVSSTRMLKLKLAEPKLPPVYATKAQASASAQQADATGGRNGENCRWWPRQSARDQFLAPAPALARFPPRRRVHCAFPDAESAPDRASRSR